MHVQWNKIQQFWKGVHKVSKEERFLTQPSYKHIVEKVSATLFALFDRSLQVYQPKFTYTKNLTHIRKIDRHKNIEYM